MTELLSRLTTSGWVLLALTIAAWLNFLIDLTRAARGHAVALRSSPLAVAIFTVWLVWLVMP